MEIRKDDDYSLYTVLRSLNFKQEIIYGSLAGVAICLVGHPFDTLKTYIQVYKTPLRQTFSRIIKQNGYSGFYRGVASPLYTSAFVNAVIFTVYECSRTLLAHHYQTSNDYLPVVMAAAGLAGFANSFFIAPIELFKVKLQIELKSGAKSSYSDVYKKIMQKSGVTGLFQGLSASMLRDCISYPFQFCSYMLMLRLLARRDPEGQNRHSHFLIGGAVGGFFCWTSSYPIDTAKTVIQATKLEKPLKFRFSGELWRVLKELYKAQGVKGLFAGYVAVMGRALCANAAGFFTWELSRSVLKY